MNYLILISFLAFIDHEEFEDEIYSVYNRIQYHNNILIDRIKNCNDNLIGIKISIFFIMLI
jgi:hypothetical protein